MDDILRAQLQESRSGLDAARAVERDAHDMTMRMEGTVMALEEAIKRYDALTADENDHGA